MSTVITTITALHKYSTPRGSSITAEIHHSGTDADGTHWTDDITVTFLSQPQYSDRISVNGQPVDRSVMERCGWVLTPEWVKRFYRLG